MEIPGIPNNFTCPLTDTEGTDDVLEFKVIDLPNSPVIFEFATNRSMLNTYNAECRHCELNPLCRPKVKHGKSKTLTANDRQLLTTDEVQDIFNNKDY